ncbi:MAG: dehydrogenase [Frankiales bacterium]|nr:dehydrogenase [Frankiales bacterium]
MPRRTGRAASQPTRLVVPAGDRPHPGVAVTEAFVVGSGPNGLSAAVVLARAGVKVTVLEAADTIGGGTRTEELTVPGVLHDVCSAVHPMGVGSPFLRGLKGIEWLWPEVDLAHPLEGQQPGVLLRSLDDTVAGLGRDGAAWRRLFGPIANSFEALNEDILRPSLNIPHHPVALARFGLRAFAPATAVARRWKGDQARALFAGVAAHSFRPLTSPGSAAIGMALTTAGHAFGWPVAKGGSRSITDAMAAELLELGGTIETGVTVTSLRDLDGIVMLDLAPANAANVIGERLPVRVRRAYRAYRHGPGAFKVDLAVEGGIPWRDEACRKAGTVHLGGTIEQVAASERDINAGRMPKSPFVLVAQQYLADPSRSRGDVHPVWSYAHVPAGWTGNATEVVLDQIERFAPGTRERIVGRSTRSTSELQAYNANYLGGDVVTGRNDLRQVVSRPRFTARPYSTGVPGVFLCSAATPPGGGVHGMCGVNAAAAALRDLRD